MSEIKLKPCPCCGEKPYTAVVEKGDEKMDAHIICDNSNCGMRMKFTIKAENRFLSFDDVINGINKAIEAWNRRTGE